MKIKDMTTKTSLEVQDEDLLVIEDSEDTKNITVGEFKQYIVTTIQENIKESISKASDNIIDNLITALEGLKKTLPKAKTYMINSWIGSTSGNVQITLKDLSTNQWLTAEEMMQLLNFNEDGIATKDIVFRVNIDGIYYTATHYSVMDFNTVHENAHEVNPYLSDSNAGFFKAHFEGLSQNDIAGITYDDIEVAIQDDNQFAYTCIVDADSFANSVPYEEQI